jgi:hypothetical protein
MRESLDGFCRGSLGQGRDEHPRMREVPSDFDSSNRHQAYPGVSHLEANQVGEIALYLIRQPYGP